MRPSNAVRTVWDAEAIDTSHLGFRPIQKIVTLHASSGFIRGIPIQLCFVRNLPPEGGELRVIRQNLDPARACDWEGAMAGARTR
jgi:hypothetical protein